MPIVSVKWQKELLSDVELDLEQPPIVFKCQLYDLTGVPPERQKIMVKGGLLKDDGDWSKLGVKEGHRFMMMGTADEIPKAPEKAPVFVEDLPDDEQDNAALGHTAGLVNLGNTCYLNSTMQCLHSVPELKCSLRQYSVAASGATADPLSHNLTIAMRDLFSELGQSRRPVAPLRFLNVLRSKYPQFSQQTNTGIYMQQDAEECWTQLLYTLSQRLRPEGNDTGLISATVKDLFGINLKSLIKCVESGEEYSETETVYAFKCHISVEVNHLQEGLKHGLKSELEKISPALGRSAIHVKESLIDQLPQYLTVQFVRFFWKRETGKAKILRKVDYPLVLDAFEFCTEQLKEKLNEPRKLLREVEDAKAGVKKPSKDVEMVDSKSSGGIDTDVSMSAETEASKPPTSNSSSQLTGIYDLVAVLTHKGRSADSGHYVAWVKQENGKWIEFDDDHPIVQREENITKLSGGGDWHMAYICLYKARMAPS